MAYKKRRYNTKKNKTKKFNKFAYAKTDSKNQAKQIVRLNKKIDNVYKTLKPELLKDLTSGTIALSSSSASVIPYETLLGLGSKTPNDMFKGNYSKYVYYNFKFFFNSTNVDLTKGKTLRIVILQNRAGRETAPAETDIFQHAQSIISPFKIGINENYKILLDKKYIISSDRDYVYKSYNFKKLIGYNKLNGSSWAMKYGRGSIFVMFITTQLEEFTINFNSSLGYTDSMPRTVN